MERSAWLPRLDAVDLQPQVGAQKAGDRCRQRHGVEMAAEDDIESACAASVRARAIQGDRLALGASWCTFAGMADAAEQSGATPRSPTPRQIAKAPS